MSDGITTASLQEWVRKKDSVAPMPLSTRLQMAVYLKRAALPADRPSRARNLEKHMVSLLNS